MIGFKRWHQTPHWGAVSLDRTTEIAAQMMAVIRGWRLAEARQRRGLTQEEAALALRLPPDRVARIEAGDEINTGIDLLRRHVVLLGGRLEVILHFSDQRNSSS